MSVLSNPKHERFAQERAKGATADAAYVAAGFRRNRSNAAQLNAKEHIQARISELQVAGAQRAEITVERVLRELGRMGFSDVRKLLKWGGTPMLDEKTSEDSGEVNISLANFVQLYDSGDLDDDTAACISEISQTKDGLIKVKMVDKLGALMAIGKHLNMFTEKVEFTGHVLHSDDNADAARALVSRYIEEQKQKQRGETAH